MLGLVARWSVRPDAVRAAGDIARAERARFELPGDCELLQPNHVGHGARQVRKRKIDGSLGRHRHESRLTGDRAAFLEPRQFLQCHIDSGGNQLLRHASLESALNLADLTVDVTAAVPVGNHGFADIMERPRSEVPRDRAA